MPSAKPKLLFVYDHKYPDLWMDGLWAALNLLEEDFDVERLNLWPDEDIEPKYDPDFILGWGAFNSLVDQWLHPFNVKKGLCIGGNAMLPKGADNYDVLFYETKWYRPQISFHKNIVHAFGVNTDIYFPITDVPAPIIWDFLGVGSFSNWKRWEKMVGKFGSKMVIGEYQRDNEAESTAIIQNLLKGGVMISNMVNPYDLACMYQWSRTVYIPADIYGGGERAVLEARACGVSVDIEDDNPKLKELKEGPIYDHHYYAAQLKKGIMSCIS